MVNYAPYFEMCTFTSRETFSLLIFHAGYDGFFFINAYLLENYRNAQLQINI